MIYGIYLFRANAKPYFTFWFVWLLGYSSKQKVELADMLNECGFNTIYMSFKNHQHRLFIADVAYLH